MKYFEILQNYFITYMTYKIRLFYFVIEVYPIETPREQKKSAEIVPRAVNDYYKPSNCFFFVSNSSWVIIPMSSSSLYFLISSTAEDAGAGALCGC